MQKIYDKWNELVNSNEGEKLKKIISVDGKTMRGNATAPQKAKHIVSAWCDTDGFCLGQETVKEKTIEITAIPKLLDTINVKGCVITIDAMGTQTAIAEKIRAKRADYTLAVKENQRKLYEEITEYLEDEELLEEIKKSGGYKRRMRLHYKVWVDITRVYAAKTIDYEYAYGRLNAGQQPIYGACLR